MKLSGNKKKVSNTKKALPDAPFRLTKKELLAADKRVVEIRVPVEFGWKPRPFLANYTSMKAHDWKEVMYENDNQLLSILDNTNVLFNSWEVV